MDTGVPLGVDLSRYTSSKNRMGSIDLFIFVCLGCGWSMEQTTSFAPTPLLLIKLNISFELRLFDDRMSY